MQFIREDINRIKRKKSKFKGRLNIFDCLTREPETIKVEEKIIEPELEAKLSQRKLRKMEIREEQRIKNLFNWYAEYDKLIRVMETRKLEKREAKRYRKLSRRLFKFPSNLTVTGKKFKKPKKNIAKVRNGRKLTYKKYIKSKLWEIRKNKLFQKFGRFCMKCQSAKQISVHHLRYDNNEFGIEKDIDLVSLCWPCHDMFHKIYGVKKDSHKDFEEFIHRTILESDV